METLFIESFARAAEQLYGNSWRWNMLMETINARETR